MKPVCLVTGASGSVGTAICKALMPTHRIVAQYNQHLPAFPSQLSHAPGADVAALPYCVQADLAERDGIRRLVEVALARGQAIDCVINCAADVRFHGKVSELWQSDDYALRQLDLNTVAPFKLVSLIHDLCWKDDADGNAARNRCVINVSSGSGLMVMRTTTQAFYGASKAALNMLTMYLALDLAPYSVRVNAVCPGRLATPEAIALVTDQIRTLMDDQSTGEVIPMF